MSTSRNSGGPASPSPASPMRPIASFSEWLSGIAEWIRSLSPTGASQYDTGWQDVTMNSGFSVQTRFNIRRVGKVVYLRGGISDQGLVMNQNFELGNIPSEFIPPTFVYVTVASQLASDPGRGEIRADGTVWMRTGKDTLSPYYMYDGVTWLVD